MNHQPPRFTPLRSFGLALFFVGFAIFVGTLGLGNYQLSEQAVEELIHQGVIRQNHAQALGNNLQPLEGRSFDTVFALVAEVDAAVNAANRELADEEKIWDYDRGQYRLHLARQASLGIFPGGVALYFALSFLLASVGALLSFMPRLLAGSAGIAHHGVQRASATARGAVGIATGAFLIGFYVLLYFYPEYIVSWIRLGDPVSMALRGQPSSQWFFYGLVYTFAVVVMGVRMLIIYRHNRYHVVRTLSVIFFQLGFAFLLPAILVSLNRPEADLKNIWPLDYSFFYAWRLHGFMSGGAFGWFLLFWGLALILIAVPLLTYFLGKRWYCSWVCGCGGLAETLGDPYRHLSSKKLRAWRIERWIVHSVLVLAVVMTVVVLINFFSARGGSPLLGNLTWRMQSWYGFLIASIFAGVVGTGFYPLAGNRVWCRFGCPLAAVLGLIQRFKSRFRITINGGQCISCGICSTFCEMGIDVRAYAQRGDNVVRASCVGCGVCATVCPRGVLRLENGPEQGRLDASRLIHIGAGTFTAVKIVDLEDPFHPGSRSQSGS